MKEFFKKIGRGIVKGAIYIYCKVVYRVKVVGKENIPKKGPIIICGNHRSFLDPPLIEVTCGRYTRFLAKEELTKNKFLAFLGVVFNAILVKRDSKEVVAIKESLKTLKNGDCLALFPEGTRNGLEKGKRWSCFFCCKKWSKSCSMWYKRRKKRRLESYNYLWKAFRF